MTKTEIIELNGEEYTLTLNRRAITEIDKICNIQEVMEIMQEELYAHIDEVNDDYVPFTEDLSNEMLEEKANKKIGACTKFIERSMFIFMYPVHKLPISKVKELIAPYINDEDEKHSLNGLMDKVIECVEKCTSLESNISKN